MEAEIQVCFVLKSIYGKIKGLEANDFVVPLVRSCYIGKPEFWGRTAELYFDLKLIYRKMSSPVITPEDVLESLMNDGTIDAIRLKIINQLKANVSIPLSHSLFIFFLP